MYHVGGGVKGCFQSILNRPRCQAGGSWLGPYDEVVRKVLIVALSKYFLYLIPNAFST